MNKSGFIVLMAAFSIYLGAHCAIAAERVSMSTAPYDEMPSSVRNSEYFVKQLYVDEKKDFDIKLSQKRNTNPKIPLQNWKKVAPSAQAQKDGIEILN